jgi:hypothetical protein
MQDSGGPYVAIAVLCERCIEDKDGTLTIIRVVDTVNRGAMGPDVPEEMEPFMLQELTLVLSLRAGKAKGRFTLSMTPLEPSGREMGAQTHPIHLKGGEQGVNLIVKLQFPVEFEGTYWFDIHLSGKGADPQLLTRVPLLIEYKPLKTS